MISKNSFFKLLREDARQRLWTIVLACVVFLLPVPIYLGMMISNHTAGYVNFPARLAKVFQADSVWLELVTLVGALICAVSGFGYLFSKKKVDFFHSLPVRREKLFAVRYLNGVLIYLVPYLLMLAVSFVLIAFSGNFTGEVFTTAMSGLLVHLAGYLTVYTTCILCVIFVGNIVVFFAVCGWTFGITMVAVAMYTWFEETFFNTCYNYQGEVFAERLHALRFLSPGYFYVEMISNGSLSLLWQQLVFTAILFFVTLAVYRARPSEGAGKAIAFPVLKPVIRASIEVLAGGCMGIMFYNMADDTTGIPGWMLLGVLLGVVLSHMLIQSIFYYDIRKCFAGKYSLTGCVVVAMGFVLVMRYDVLGYDAYLPKENKVESVAIRVSGLDVYLNSYYYNTGEVTYYDELDIMELTDLETVYPYLKTVIADSSYYYETLQEDGIRQTGYFSVAVAYHLKSGKTVYRRYRANGIREEAFAPIFESEEYKTTHYMDIYTIPQERIAAVTARYAMNAQTMTLSATEREEFMSILRRELMAQNLEEKLDTFPVAVITITVGAETGYFKEDGVIQTYDQLLNHELPVYASYTETLRFLEERGFSAERQYEWTGQERMRLVIPDELAKQGIAEGAAAWAWEDAVVYDTDGYALEKAAAITEDWSYGSDTIPIAAKDWNRVYALCEWEELYHYNPLASYAEDYVVYLDVPVDGYNNYETHVFVIDRSADLSFLWE